MIVELNTLTAYLSWLLVSVTRHMDTDLGFVLYMTSLGIQATAVYSDTGLSAQ